MNNSSKILYTEGNFGEETSNLVRNNESSLYPGFVITRELVRSLLGRIQGNSHLVRYTEKFAVSRVRHIGTPMYITH